MLSPSLLAVLTAIRWQDAAVLAADMLRAAVLMALSPLGQRPQRFTGFQMRTRVQSGLPELDRSCSATVFGPENLGQKTGLDRTPGP